MVRYKSRQITAQGVLARPGIRADWGPGDGALFCPETYGL